MHYGIPPAALPAPAPSELTGFTDGALNLAVVAAFEPRKGHLSLIDALAQVPNVRAALVGAGSATAAIEARIAELGLGERVRLLGWRDDVPAILAAADALALPSLGNECLPYAILEAMAAGLPVLSTDVAGIPEMVDDGRTGYVVAPGDSAALAARLAALADAPERARAFGAAGRERVSREFSLEQMVNATTAIWGVGASARAPIRGVNPLL